MWKASQINYRDIVLPIPASPPQQLPSWLVEDHLNASPRYHYYQNADHRLSDREARRSTTSYQASCFLFRPVLHISYFFGLRRITWKQACATTTPQEADLLPSLSLIEKLARKRSGNHMEHAEHVT
jgi:hypothetical protein